MEGLERLEKEVLKLNNSNITEIFNYLKIRKDLYDKFNNEEKSITQMYEYICNQAEKQKIGKVAMIADNLVYFWAVSYFLKSNEELGLKQKKDEDSNENTSKKKETKNNGNQISMFEEEQK